MKEKIIQIIPYQDMLLCLTSEGNIYNFDPRNMCYEWLSEGLNFKFPQSIS